MSHDYESLKLAFTSADLSLTQMCEFRELVDGAIAHEQEQIKLFTFGGVEHPELLRQFRLIRHVLGSVGVKVPENPSVQTGEGLIWPAYRPQCPTKTLELSEDAGWKLTGPKSFSGILDKPESHLGILLANHGIDAAHWKFAPSI